MGRKLIILCFVFLLVLSFLSLSFFGFVYAQSQIAGNWDDEEHDSFHSSQEIVVRVGEEFYSLQDVIDGKMNSEDILSEQEISNSHYAENVKVKIGERYFSLQSVVKYGLYDLINPLASDGSSDSGGDDGVENGPKTFTIQKASSGYWSPVCTARDGYTPKTGRMHVKYTRDIGALDIAEGKHKITCSYENGADQVHELELKEEYELIAEGSEENVISVTDVNQDYNSGEGAINGPIKNKFSYYAKIENDVLSVRVYVDNLSICPIYKVPANFGYRSVDIKNFGEVKCTLEKI